MYYIQRTTTTTTKLEKTQNLYQKLKRHENGTKPLKYILKDKY